MAKNPGRTERCGANLGLYNVAKDLQEALVQYGCGTDRHWQIIWQVNFAPNTCYPAGAGPTQRQILRASIRTLRNHVRALCIQKRTAAGLDPYINDDLRGKTCGT